MGKTFLQLARSIYIPSYLAFPTAAPSCHLYGQKSISSDSPSIKFDRLDNAQRVYLETIKKDYDDANAALEVRHSDASERYVGKFASLYTAYYEYCNILNDMGECQELAADPEMKTIANAEFEELSDHLNSSFHALENAILESLAKYSDGDIFLEIRMATGGLESSLFAGELYDLYKRVAETKGLRWSVLEEDLRGENGVGSVVVEISGQDSQSTFQFEAGVHRVQRVPVNDTRIQTSTAVVLIIDKPEIINNEIPPEDIEVTYGFASGPGGQHVASTNSKCYILHKPTKIIIYSQDFKLASENKKECLRKLQGLLIKQEMEDVASSTDQTKRLQAKHGDRSDKIRTYNFKSGLITDHRYKVTTNNIGEYLTDPQVFLDFHRSVSTVWKLQKLSEIASELS